MSLSTQNVDEGDEKSDATIPVIYEDKDTDSDADADSMDTESGEEEDGKEPEPLSDLSDFEDME